MRTIIALILCLPTGVRAYLAEFEAAEAALLKALPTVERAGPTLTIKTAAGPITFKDNPISGEQYLRCLLTAVLPLEYDRTDYVVHGFGYEQHQFVVVNGKTGAKLSLTSNPVLSPDSKHYLAATLDIDAGYEENELSIFKTSDFNRVYSVGWSSEPGEPRTGPEKALWKSPKKVAFTELTLKPDGSFSRRTRIVEFRNGKWIGPPGRSRPAAW